jgi:small GTP-binding protein
MVLDVPGASEMLSATLAWVPSDDATRARIRAIVDAQGEADLARWRAAFARAAGDRVAARAALDEAVANGDADAAGALLDAAIDDRDDAALARALGALKEGDHAALADDARHIPPPVADPANASSALDAIAQIANDRLAVWADAIARDVARTLVPPSGGPSARRGRPVRVAIVGEFNAGKSTFINALIGADVAPTGVLPTTATLHHLRYAPDPIARVLLARAEGMTKERIVTVADLRATLKSLQDADPDGAPVKRVEILLPLASLTRVEILDTPGFNAPDARHTEAARAAFDEADAAIWLLDAGQAMKQTERALLEEAKASRLPVQILVNKADRLAPGDLGKVMQTLRASLEEVGLRSWSDPIALSARKALAGKLGDAVALEASGWSAVQSLLDEQIVGRDEELKERAMRRRAAQIVERLRARAAQTADAERAAAEASSARAQAIGRAAARVERDADDAADRLARSLSPAAEAWERDLAVVVTGRDANTVARDRVLGRYRVERAIAHIATPLANALASIAPEAAIAPQTFAPLARAIVRGAVSAAEKDDDAIALAIGRAAIASLVEHLFAQAVARPSPPRAVGLLRELAALEAALVAQ